MGTVQPVKAIDDNPVPTKKPIQTFRVAVSM
jgi:hypothetical protein